MRDRRVFEFRQTRVRGFLEARAVVRQTVVEFGLTIGHDGVDGLDVSAEILAEARRVRADPLDDAVAALPHQSRERIQLLVQLTSFGAQRGDQRGAAPAKRFLEGCNCRGERLVHAVAADGDRGDRLARGRGEFVAGLRDLLAPLRQRRLRGFLKAFLNCCALVGDRLDRALHGLLDLAAQSARGLVDVTAQLRVARLEMLRPCGACRVQEGARVLRRRAEGAGQPLACAGERLLERLPAHNDRFVQPLGRHAEPRGEFVAVAEYGLGKLATAGLETLDEVIASFAELSRQDVARRGQTRRHRVAMELDRLDRLSAARLDAVDDPAVLRRQCVRGGLGRRRQLRGDRLAVRNQGFDGGGAGGADAVDEVLVARAEIGDEGLAGRLDSLIRVGHARDNLVRASAARVGELRHDVDAEGGEGFPELRALRRDPVDGRRAGAVHGDGDLLRGGAERCRDARADIGYAFAEALGDAFEIGGDAPVRVVHGGAHLAAVGDDRLALVGHLGDQRAHAALIVGIGALERRDLRAHERLQLGGARQRPLDAVAHQGDFAADRLRQRGDLLARHRLRLRQSQRGLSDRAGCGAQFL